MSQIHATSLVENGAVIGKNVEIGPFCHVGANVSIGDGCILKSHVVIDGWTTLGEKNTIYPWSSIGGEPQDLTLVREKTLVTIDRKTSFEKE
jgi:Acyl-[acyl carrier protein]--UDP-N-acetylglucosamine O-acyltransferase